MGTDVPPEILMQRLQEYEKLWQKFMEYFNAALEKDDVSPEEDEEFKKLQVDLTRRAQFLTLTVPENIFDLWGDIKKLMSETPSLTILKKEVAIRVSSFRSLWHDISIALNQKQGQLRQVLQDSETGKSKRKK